MGPPSPTAPKACRRPPETRVQIIPRSMWYEPGYNMGAGSLRLRVIMGQRGRRLTSYNSDEVNPHRCVYKTTQTQSRDLTELAAMAQQSTGCQNSLSAPDTLCPKGTSCIIYYKSTFTIKSNVYQYALIECVFTQTAQLGSTYPITRGTRVFIHTVKY